MRTSDNGTVLVTPLFVRSRTIGFPPPPDAGTDRLTRRAGVGHLQRVGDPEATQFAKAQSRKPRTCVSPACLGANRR
jgi:hypothetical protein